MKSSAITADLSVNGMKNPLGVMPEEVCFSWRLLSAGRNQAQSAYQIKVIQNDGGRVCWDTGRVESPECRFIPYRGESLLPCSRYGWQVTVWDKNGSSSGWSELHEFETCLAGGSDFGGLWIGMEPRPGALIGSRWIWHPNEQTESVVFTRELDLPEGQTVFQAWFDGAADREFSFFVNDVLVAKSNTEWGQDFRSPFCWIDFAGSLHTGANQLRCEACRPGGQGGFIGSIRILLSGGGRVELPTGEDWQAAAKRPGGSPEPAAAAVAAKYGEGPWGAPARRGCAPLLRREFSVTGEIAGARLYVCGLGYYDLALNGTKLDDRLLCPSYTQFSKRVHYDTYDVTEFLSRGRNCIAAELGRGYYACGKDWIGSGEWLSDPKLLLRLDLVYADGSRQAVVSDTAWRAAESPTFDDSVWYGEKYDAAAEQPGWKLPGFDDTRWEHAVRRSPPAGVPESRPIPPIRICEELPCRLIGRPKPDTYVYDAGKILAGWARLSFRGQKGRRVRITYGEILKTDGTVDTMENDRDMQFWEVPQTDFYLCAADGPADFEPKFSYKGFRYLQVDGISEPCGATALCIHSDVEKTGDFSCSFPLFNSIHEMVCNSILSNLHSIPTDTPMHEKRGWTGDGQVIADCACRNFDMLRFFSKWVQDIADTQQPSGAVSHTCPGPIQDAPTPAWMSALILVPWTLYEQTGDTRLFRRHYPAFQKYLSYELGRLQNGVSSDRYYSDWCTPDGCRAPEGGSLLATAYVFLAARRMSQIASLLGREQDAADYARATEELRGTINTVFYDSGSGSYHTEIEAGYRQTSNVLPLAFGITPPEIRQDVADRLARDVMVVRKGHLSTGCFGLKYLAPVLSEYGHSDAAFTLAGQQDYPSWGYWLKNGATACLEGWEMNVRSYDHYFLGTIDDWFYTHVAGIRPLEPGYRTVGVKPYLNPAVSWAKAHVKTPYGAVRVRWETLPRGFRLETEIPAGARAVISLPALPGSRVTESGSAAETIGKEAITPDGYHEIKIGSGSYCFETETPATPL